MYAGPQVAGWKTVAFAINCIANTYNQMNTHAWLHSLNYVVDVRTSDLIQ